MILKIYIFFESHIANPKQPAIAIAHPIIFGNGNVSPTVNKYKATNITTLLPYINDGRFILHDISEKVEKRYREKFLRIV